MENRALGKGLSALIPEKVAKNDGVSMLKVSEINESSVQPRTDYADDKLSELMASIKEKGILQPILVRPRDGGYEVIAGERRLRAAKSLNLEDIPAIIKTVNDQEAFVLALIENIQRESLNPVEEAQAYRKLINDFNFTQDSVAQSIGKDRSTVGNFIRLLKLPEQIQKSLFEGKLSVGHARALITIENSDEQAKIFNKTIAEQLSVRELENLIKSGVKVTSTPKLKIRSAAKESFLLVIEEELQRTLGTKVRIQSKKKRGKIVVEYYSHEDLERIKDIIKK